MLSVNAGEPARIVLTGGPGGGKTTFLNELRQSDPNTDRFILVPEAATLLIRAGHRPGTTAFQLAVVHLQLALEASCSLPARPGQVLVCDRGTVDSLAYWRLLGAQDGDFHSQTGLDPVSHLSRYFGAVHFRTAALGAEESYRRIEELGARVESPEEAIRVDSACERVWSGHPRFEIVENGNGGWAEKSRAAAVCLNRLLSEIASTSR